MLVVHHSRGEAALGVLLSASLVSEVSCPSFCKRYCFSLALLFTTGKVSADDTSHTV